MNIAPTVLFAVILVGLNQIYLTSSEQYPPFNRRFYYFIWRLERAINTSSINALPFMLTDGVIENLRWTSEEFKNLCLNYDAEHLEEGEISLPLKALNRTIEYIFYNYKKSVGVENDSEIILEEIEKVDPIGLNVYLTKKNVENSSPMFMDFVLIFLETMYDRVRLFKMKTEDSQFSILNLNDFWNLQKLPNDIRNRIATEYVDTPLDPIDMFSDLVTELTSKKMYHIVTDLNDYEMHIPSTNDDIQLIYGTYYFHNAEYWTGINITYHAVCILYKASSQTVHVYDSLMDRRLDDRQLNIISKLYPYSLGIVFERPIALQNHHPTCAIFAMIYATMLHLGRDPAIHSIKLNKVHGDETIYMRMHILNMLATRKLSLLK